MANANECRAAGAKQLIKALFVSRIQGAGRFVEHRIARFGNQNACKSQALLLADRQEIAPIGLGIETADLIDQPREIDVLEDLQQLLIEVKSIVEGIEKLSA